MPAPSAIRLVLNETEQAARLELTSLAARGLDGIHEAEIAVAAFNARMADLLAKRIVGTLSALQYSQCCESEADALKLNLASIKNETVRAEIGNLLGTTARFLANIVGAGLRAIPGVG